MRSARIAEWILALVTTRDRATCIVGDLTEGATTPGAIKFWPSVLRTVASLLWREIVEHPAHITGLALLGITVYIMIDLLFAGLDGLAFFVAASRSGSYFHLDSMAWKVWFAVPVVLSQLLVGGMLARWARGREMAAYVVYAVCVSIYNLLPALGNNGALATVFCVLIVPIGAAWGRYRRLVTRPPRSL